MHEDDLSTKLLTSPKRKRKKKKKKRKDDLFDIPGVRKIVLSELTQKIIECIAGDHVTSENPWKYVEKELVQDNLELHEESSEFLPLRREILEYPRKKVLMGYIADETRDTEDEFYICVTEEATDIVNGIIEKMKQEQEDRLYYQLYKDIHPWHSMGTDQEVDEAIVKNNRPLIEVEVETQYPIFPGKVQFRLLPAEKKRDGYMELRCTEENVVNVFRKRIDNYTQVAPEFVSTEAQTICSYPKNSATQYLYDVGKTDDLLNKCESNIVNYANDNFEDLSDLLRVNGVINLYSNDFDSLIIDNSTIESRAAAKEFLEYMFFMDVNLCKGKMISDIYWHQMWTGTLAIAYADTCPNIFYNGPTKDDEVFKAVHGVNPVLIWSFMDGLKPKLILESPREVHRVTFCKFDENILIGGCKNGQIIIWDIRNKLQKVEEREVLNTAQQKYRNYMHGLMGWMKNIHDVSIVRPAAVSDLRYSHKAAITGITWLNPYYEFSKMGNLSTIEEYREDRSMQLLTSSLDGSVLIWDLKKKPTINAGGYKPKRLKRLKKRPSALEIDVSPYRVLHLNLKPIYKINVSRKDNKKPVAITRCSSSYCFLDYEEINPDKSRKFNIKDRILFRPIFKRPIGENYTGSMKIGTVEGDYSEIRWEGQDFDSGEVVNSEIAKYTYDAKFHDGPIISIHTSSSSKATLTVGGKIFALWRSDLSDRPVLWRRSRQMYTKGEWNIFQPFKIVLHSISGMIQKWILSINSKGPIFNQVMSNSFLTSSGIHPFRRQKNIYGIGDEQGAFRLFFIPPSVINTSEELIKHMDDYLDREINRKNLFLKWQNDFNKKNESYIAKMKEDAERIAREEEMAREAEKSEDKVPEKHVRKGPQPGKYIEWIKEQRQAKEEARIKAMIINKKQLDTKELEKRRKPLQKLDEENERKKRKQKQRLKEGENIFRETVASLFPDVMKEKPPLPPDPYAGGEPTEEKEKCYVSYTDAIEEAVNFIDHNPFRYEFSFKNLLMDSKRKIQDSAYSYHPHKRRYDKEKRLRRGGSSTSNFKDDDEKEEEMNKEDDKESGYEPEITTNDEELMNELETI